LGAKRIRTSAKKPSKTIVIQDTLTDRAKAWAEKNSLVIILVAAAILLPIIYSLGMSAYTARNEAKARTDYSAIAPKLPSGEKNTPEEWQKVMPDLEKFVSEHKGTQMAVIAQAGLAKAYYETRRYDDAIKTALDALKAAQPGPGLKPLIQYQLAYAYEAAGKRDDALREWTGLKSDAPGMEREADWRIAEIYAAGKDYSKAAEMYSKAIEAPGSYPPQPLLEQELSRAREQAGTGAKQESNTPAK